MQAIMEDMQAAHKVDGHNYIIWLFRLLSGFVLLVILLLIVLEINDTVSFREGEILSSAPQTDYKASFESQLTAVKVKPGQKVNKGDTMVVLFNEENTMLYAREKTEVQRLEQSLAGINKLLQAADTKSSSLQAETGISSSNRNLNDINTGNAIKALEEQYRLQQQRLASAKERNKADSILYSKDMISKMEYNSGLDATRDLQEAMAATAALLKRQQTEVNTNANNFERETATITRQKIEAVQELQTLLQQQTDTENKLLQSKENLALLEHNVNRQYIIAQVSGTANFVFNTVQTSNIIPKDQLLVSLSPASHSYYAKAYIPEKDIQYLRTGMSAHIKLDAYYHLEHGLLKGNVNYISERKENNKFYVLVQLENNPSFALKPGYSIKGEVIIERLPLYKFFIKKIFKDTEKKADEKTL